MSKTLCLGMICKNEEHCILECLESVYKHIDYWVICDTGSTDKTREIIYDFFKEKNIPGELYEDEFKNMGHNRTLMLSRAKNKADYILLIDADDYIYGELDKSILETDSDVYQLKIKRGLVTFKNNVIIKGSCNWKFCGVGHGFLRDLDNPNPSVEKIDNTDYYLVSRTIGSRSKNPEKYKNEAELIKQEFLDTLVYDPDYLNRYSLFYMAQSYFDAHMFEESIRWYSLYTKLKDTWIEELFESYIRIAQCMIMLNHDTENIKTTLDKAINIFPDRAEPLYILGLYYNRNQIFDLAYQYLRQARDKDFDEVTKKYILFIDKCKYGKYVNDELSVACFYVGRYEEGYRLLNEIIDDEEFIEQKDRLTQNKEFFEIALKNIYK